MVDAIVNDRKRILPSVAILDNEFGCSDIAIGVPTVLGKNGMERVIELELNEQEQTDFDNSVTQVKNDLEVLTTL